MTNSTWGRASFFIRTCSRLILSLLLMAFAGLLKGQQNANADSLRLVLAKIEPNTSQALVTRVQLANYFIYHNLDSADYHISVVLNHPSLQQLLPRGFSRHYLIKAWVHQGRMEMETAKHYLQKAYEIAKIGDDREAIVELQMNYGSLLTDLKDSSAWNFAKALIAETDTSANNNEREAWLIGHQYLVRLLDGQDRHEEALVLLLELKENPILDKIPDYRYGIYNSLSVILNKIRDYRLAVKYLREALSIESLHDFERSSILLNLSEAFFANEQYDSCSHYLSKIANYSTLYPPEQWQYHFNKARLAQLTNEPDSALYHIEIAKSLVDQMQNPFAQIRTNLTKAQIHARQQQWPEVFPLVQELEVCYDTQASLWDLYLKTVFAGVRIEAQLAQGNAVKLDEFQQYKQLAGQQAKRLSDRRLKEIVTEYEVKEQAQKSEILKRDLRLVEQRNKSQKKILWSLLLTVLSLGIAVFFYRRNLKLSHAYTALVEKDKAKLAKENKQLVFAKSELVAMNESLQLKLNSAVKNPKPSTIQKIKIIGVDKTHLIPVDAVTYAVAEDDGLRFYLQNGKNIWSDISLKKAKSNQLEASFFLQIFRSIIVNWDCVQSIDESSLHLKDGTRLKIGRTFRRAIKKQLIS